MEYLEEKDRVVTEEVNEDKEKGDKEVKNEGELGSSMLGNQCRFLLNQDDMESIKPNKENKLWGRLNSEILRMWQKRILEL
jgi:hypothetical protein